MLLPCKCKHNTQDQMYGPNMRVHNLRKGGGQAACTVCGDVKAVAKSEKTVAKSDTGITKTKGKAAKK